MRILVISDTHGHLDIINHLVEKTESDAVIHAGDLGFYDENSAERLSERELRLRVVHSDLSEELKARFFKLNYQEKVEFIKQEAALSDLPLYIRGEKEFKVPVYAVWGNHEDIEVINYFRDRKYSIKNFNLLDENEFYNLGMINLFGIGGNLLIGKKFFQKPVAGGNGKVWSTVLQYTRLWELINKKKSPDKRNVFVNHVSPGKEPLLSRIAAHYKADFIISGHMGSPYCCVWNNFAIRETGESVNWMSKQIEELKSIWEEEKEKLEMDDNEGAGLIEKGLELISTLPEETVKDKRGKIEPAWYRSMFSINLPDAEEGYAVMTEDSGFISLETYSKGIGINAKK